ncbi:hypothetical protein M2J86_24305 [Citrobacter freundii]|uniref:hypothetical protein n=1 Tax=Citrobacter TaxID=544 RepID=UPI0006652E04|nr:MULTISPECIES: hypothetical protein [Citrobacter freundii complex]MDT7115124.1 hypothetical protein [Citrobacter braakii]MDT7480774.1 hypothetical protein [Citrobacter portucalensis]MDX7129575.1 hypothetical protein [Citrobacter portucalensis]MEB0864207.1 hypothetical protein [Citrobacter youngae]MEC5782205.1 hypothetical protein [Citrobacter freundii]
MIQYLVKNGITRIQINDAGKRVLETLQYFYKSKPTKIRYDDIIERAGCSQGGVMFWLHSLKSFGMIDFKETGYFDVTIKSIVSDYEIIYSNE